MDFTDKLNLELTENHQLAFKIALDKLGATIENPIDITMWMFLYATNFQDKEKHWNTEDWDKDRENMLPRLQAMRVRVFNKAVKKGHLQTAAQILDSLGKVIGESVETVNIQAPELSIKVESK